MLSCGALTLHGAKRKPCNDNPETLGEHLRKRRYELRLSQKDLASRLAVNQWTSITWELETRQPSARYMPAILSFLGYDPFPEPVTLGERIVARRRLMGIARKRLAWALGVDEGALRSWEADQKLPRGDGEAAIDWFLAAPSDAIAAIVPQAGRRQSFKGTPRSSSSAPKADGRGGLVRSG